MTPALASPDPLQPAGDSDARMEVTRQDADPTSTDHPRATSASAERGTDAGSADRTHADDVPGCATNGETVPLGQATAPVLPTSLDQTHGAWHTVPASNDDGGGAEGAKGRSPDSQRKAATPDAGGQSQAADPAAGAGGEGRTHHQIPANGAYEPPPASPPPPVIPETPHPHASAPEGAHSAANGTTTAHTAGRPSPQTLVPCNHRAGEGSNEDATPDTTSPTTPDWGACDTASESLDDCEDLHGQLDLLLDSLDRALHEARTWPFQYGASLTSCVWAPVWQALAWAASDGPLLHRALDRLTLLRMGVSAIHGLRDAWPNRQVEDLRAAHRFLRERASANREASPSLLGVIPRRVLDELVAPFAPVLAVDCLSECGGPDLWGH